MNRCIIFLRKLAIASLAHAFLLFNAFHVYAHSTIDYEQSFVGSMVAGGLGDALGRVTEFIDSTNAIFERYPTGVRSFADFKPTDWSRVPATLKDNNIAPYTDDTAMAK